MKLKFLPQFNQSSKKNIKGLIFLHLISFFFLFLIQFDLSRIIDPINERVAALTEELQSSQKAFEIYRERARVSLKKTAADQKQSDEKILQMTQNYKVSFFPTHSSFFPLNFTQSNLYRLCKSNIMKMKQNFN